MSARTELVRRLSEDSLGGVATLHDVTDAEQLVDAVVAEALNEAGEACSSLPCDAETGEPCDQHERKQAHAEGEHAFCGPECNDTTGEAPVSQPDDTDYALRMPNGDVYLTKFIFPEHQRRMIAKGAVSVQRTIRYGAWVEVAS